MVIQEAEYSLEVVVRATTCTNVFGLTALVSGFLFVPIWECTGVISYYAVSVIKMRDGGPHTENHLLCHDRHFRVTPSAWKLHYRCVALL